MPNRAPSWDPINNTGNPTKSTEVNDLLKVVKLEQERNQGGCSPQARRPMKQAEFVHTSHVLRSVPEDKRVGYGMPAYLALQFSMMGRVDCVSQLLKDKVRPHEQYMDIALCAQLVWSKNVREEREAPFLILLGAMNHFFCVLMNLSLWLEVEVSTNPGAATLPYIFSFSNDIGVPEGGEKAKRFVASTLSNMFKNNAYYQQTAGPLGTHDGGAGAPSVTLGLIP